jgi:Tol biopolymer transport system component/predicted Ser/Thr protein kinase
MGEVYRALDTRLERTVAVKVLAERLSPTAEARQRFEREARTISRLSHPHVCALHDVGREGEIDFLVMEYLVGETLAERLAKGPMPLAQALRHGAEIAQALDAAHRLGIVHRDLKPGNIMLTKSGVKLLDFGLARAMEGAGSAPSSLTALPTRADLTQEGAILGTLQYMPPEQLDGQETDPRTDIFALGAVLYEMTTGRKAFEGKSQASLISAIMKEEPAPISSVLPLMPQALDRAVLKCLAKDPDARWQSARDLGSELTWIASGGAAPVSKVPTRQASAWRLPAALGSIGLVLLLAVYLGMAYRGRTIEPRQPVHSFLAAPEKTSFQLTGDSGAPVALSPNGEMALFGAGGQLWLHSLRTGASTPLRSTENARFPFWSPDSRSIAFFSDGRLKTMDASGGPVQIVCNAANPRGGTWGAGDVIVFAPDIRSGLFQVPASGGTPTALTQVDWTRHSTHRWPQFLPDGRDLLYLAAQHGEPRSEESGVYLASLDGKENRRLIATNGSPAYAPGRILSVKDASLMAYPFDVRRLEITGPPVRVADDVHFDAGLWRGTFSASMTGLLAFQISQAEPGGQLSVLDPSGREIATVGERSLAYWPQLSPDGRRLAIIQGDPSSDLWIWDLDRGIRIRGTTGALVTSTAAWSPDGSRLAMLILKEANQFILAAAPANGAGTLEILARSTERCEPTDWSPDGRYLLCDHGTTGATDIWALPIADPAKAFPVVATPFLDRGGQFSPDGRSVAYVSTESTQGEIYVTPFPGGGAKWKVSADGGSQPRWSRDGRQLYFFVSGSGHLMSAEIVSDGERIQVGVAHPLFRVNLYAGPRGFYMHSYDVFPDGKRFLVNSAGEAGPARVALVTDWDRSLGE